MFYVLAIGGTGNKVLESMVYGAAADAFYIRTENNPRLPPTTIHMLSIDVDASCGNTTRAKIACASYNQVQAFMAPIREHRGFHTALDLRQWNMSSEVRELSIDAQVKNHKTDQPLAHALFNKTESELEYNEGFRGHPDLGVLFFSDMLQKVEDPDNKTVQDDLKDTLQSIENDLAQGDTVRVALVGSIFGGTGAAGIPILAKYLRNRYQDKGDRFRLSATLMLPYYKVPASAANEDMEIVIDSTVFMDKAKTALDFYGTEEMVGAPGRPSVFDSLYILGLPKEGFVSTRTYATGSSAQENDSHVMEWLATRSIAHFFRQAVDALPPRGCIIYQMHTPTFCWESFDEEEKAYRITYGGLLKAGAVLMAECYPHIIRHLRDERLIRNRDVNYYAAFFGNARNLNSEQRDALVREVDGIAKFFCYYCRWVVQVLRSLPPTMRKPMESETRQAEIARHLDELMAARADIRLARKRAAQGVLADLETVLKPLAEREQALAAEQAEIDAQLPPQKRNTLLYYARRNAQSDMRHVTLKSEQARVDLEKLRAEPPERVTQMQMDQQEQALLAAKRQLEKQACLCEALDEEWQKVSVSTVAARHEEESAEIPENDLLNAELLALLEPLLQEGGKPFTPAQTGAAEKLLAHIEELSIQRLRDTRDIGHILAALGQGAQLRDKAAGASPAGEFLAALLLAVLDEVLL